MKKIISIALALVMLLSISAVTAFGADPDDEATVSIRIEGASQTIGEWEYSFSVSEAPTLDKVLTSFSVTKGVSIEGLDKGYITEINGEKSAQFGGWDGWYYSVNGTAPSVGVNDYAVNDKDEVVFYYGGYPCQIPVPDYSRVGEGVISFKSYDAEYDENYNATYSWVPVTNATVIFNGDDADKYTTDDNGEIKFSPSKYLEYEKVTVQIEKTDASGAPAVCRFKSSEGFSIDPSQISTVITANNLTLYVNTKASIKASIKNAVGKTTYASSKKNIATVDKYGKVTAKKAGSTTVTISNNGVSKKITVKVKNPSLKKKSATFKVGKTAAIKVNGSGKFTFKSSNKKIAKVTDKGVVKGVRKGKATITVTANGKKLKFSVTVK